MTALPDGAPLTLPQIGIDLFTGHRNLDRAGIPPPFVAIPRVPGVQGYSDNPDNRDNAVRLETAYLRDLNT